MKIKSIYLYWKHKYIYNKTMTKLILFEHPVSYAKLKDAYDDVIENFISNSKLDYEDQAYWFLKLHKIKKGKVIPLRHTVDDLDNQLYIEYIPESGFFGKICLYDGYQTEGFVELTDETMIKGICIVSPKNYDGECDEVLYENLIKMGNFIKNSLETDDSLICYSVDWDTELLGFLGAFHYLK